MKTLLSLLFILLILSINIFATAQSPDVIFYDNKIFDLYSNPLESFYKNEKDRPNFSIAPGGVTSSGNWRGYIAYWEIVDDMLYLKAIDAWLCAGTPVEKATGKAKCEKADIKQLFSNKYSQNKVYADWFTGELRIPDGEQLQYVHMGYGSVYERDIVFSIKAGKVSEKKIIDNTTKKPKTEREIQLEELEKLKNSPLGNKKISDSLKD